MEKEVLLQQSKFIDVKNSFTVLARYNNARLLYTTHNYEYNSYFE